MDFTVTEELGGKRIIHELRPGGKSISVTNDNKLHYVHAMADFKLNRQVRALVHFLFLMICEVFLCITKNTFLYHCPCRYFHLQMHFIGDSVISFHHLG